MIKYLNEAEELEVRARLENPETLPELAVALCYFTGARVSEIAAIEVSDLTGDTLFIRSKKMGESRDIPIPANLALKIQERIRELNVLRANAIMAGCEAYPRIFPFCIRTIQRTWENVRPKDCAKSIHALRHSCAVRIYKKTRDILLVKGWLGHKAVSNTEIYAKIVNQSEEFRKLIGA